LGVYQKVDGFIAEEFHGEFAGKVFREKIPTTDYSRKTGFATYRDHK
jgi:hypothetical protein